MIYKCFMHCDRVCLNNPNNIYIYIIINDKWLCQSDNTFVLVKIYTWPFINDLM